jgi:hypothetical protein
MICRWGVEPALIVPAERVAVGGEPLVQLSSYQKQKFPCRRPLLRGQVERRSPVIRGPCDALEQVPETLTSLAELLDQADNFRHADTNIRGLTEEEFLRGKEQLRRAVQTARAETRTNWLDLLVLR